MGWLGKGAGAAGRVTFAPGKGKGAHGKGQSADNSKKRKATEAQEDGSKKPKTTSTGASAKGSIKRYNGTKGFGFISVDGIESDIFFHWKDLPENVPQQDLTGKDVAFTLAISADGKMKAEGITLC